MPFKTGRRNFKNWGFFVVVFCQSLSSQTSKINQAACLDELSSKVVAIPLLGYLLDPQFNICENRFVFSKFPVLMTEKMIQVRLIFSDAQEGEWVRLHNIVRDPQAMFSSLQMLPPSR